MVSAHAQVGTAAEPVNLAADENDFGKVIARLRLTNIMPQDTSASITKLGGRWTSTNTAGFDLDASLFLTSNIAVDFGMSAGHHSFTIRDSNFGTVPVGNAELLVPSVMLQYHFLPHERFGPYLGVGPAAAVFIDPSPGGTLVDKLYFDSQVGVAFQAGFDVTLGGPFVLNVDIKQLLVQTIAYSPHPPRVPVQAKVDVNPTIFGIGLGYRF